MNIRTWITRMVESAGTGQRRMLLLFSGALLAFFFLAFFSSVPEPVAESGQNIHAPAIGCAADFEHSGAHSRIRGNENHLRGMFRGNTTRIQHFHFKLLATVEDTTLFIPVRRQHGQTRHPFSLRDPQLLLFLKSAVPARAAPAA